jgi:Xaa-Pro aminopeptidase
MGKTRKLVDGDLMVVDIGAKFNQYCGDITRTYPVSGKFTPRQREVYQLVLDAGKAAAAAMKPNQQSLSQMTTFAKDFFRKSPLRAKDKNGLERTMDYFFIHSLSHYIGKNVHGSDLGFSSSDPVKPGRVFSVEPGLYLDSEGFGIRLEDDYMMTDKSAVNIFPNTPIEAAHIEALMALRVLLPEVAHYQETGDLPQPDTSARNDHMDF